MSDCNPFDLNNLRRNGFTFLISRLPDVQFRAQKLSIPGIQLGQAERPTPFVKLAEPGHIEYGLVTVQFMISESMVDYISIVDWMNSLGAPDKFNVPKDKLDWKSDISAMILNSSSRPGVEVKFTNAWPVSISGLEFDTSLRETEFAVASASFRFDRIYFSRLTS